MAEAVAQAILALLSGTPAWVKIIVLAMVPITEYQLAIPYAIERFGFTPGLAYLLSLGGSAAIFFPLYFGLERLRTLLEHVYPPLLRPLDSFIARGERKLKDNFERYGALALFLFLVIPFPLTGVWTATVGAVALKIPFRGAAAGILCGVLGGQAVVVAVTLGLSSFMRAG